MYYKEKVEQGKGDPGLPHLILLVNMSATPRHRWHEFLAHTFTNQIRRIHSHNILIL